MREIILDTETTGLELTQGHRIIELGCVELIDRKRTGKNFHCYINPQRTIEAEASLVHGLTTEFLATKKVFAEIVDDFLAFLGTDSPQLLAHNAEFDLGFLNHEIKLTGHPITPLENYFTVVDTLALARKKFPGQRNTLDALCKRYKVDLTQRQLQGHGALLDAELLTEVYLHMTSGQGDLFAELGEMGERIVEELQLAHTRQHQRPLLIINANSEELAAHEKFLQLIKQSSTKSPKAS